ncbi:hypothetical protein [Frankia sp. R43]|uniref:hypothetical protein n=1 Tax=Frankia sp. R43 TaxID=269536 RepID=UPI000B2AFBB4|nr:hypothetical protein [Frankia sp. R43]
MSDEPERISATTAASLARLDALLIQVQSAVDAVRVEIERVAPPGRTKEGIGDGLTAP